MKRFLLMTGAAVLLALVSIEEASARYRGGGGGFQGAGFSGGYRGAAFRTGAVGGYGYRGARIGYVGGARYGGARYVGRRVGGYYPYRYGYRRYAPYAVGLGVAAATAYSYNSCYRYNGWQWVNVCYGPYGYRYY